MWLYYRVRSPKDADSMANSVDPDQSSSLIWDYTVCPGLSVRKLRIITLLYQFEDLKFLFSMMEV